MTKYFKKEEFTCKCGCGLNNISTLLVDMLTEAREIAEVPFIVNSGCRCHKHNTNVGGSLTSSHTKGYAVDISVNSKNKHIILKSLRQRFRRIGIADNFIHVDIDPTKPIAEWSY